MGINNIKSLLTSAELRRQAEEQLKTISPGEGFPRSEDEVKRLLHELQVHQIELEMQNAELRQVRDELEKALVNYTDLYDFAPIGYFTLDRKGVVNTANFTGATILGVERGRLIGRSFGQFVDAHDRPVFTAFLDTVFARQGKNACEVMLTTEEHSLLFVHIEAAICGEGQGCRVAVIDINARRQAEAQVQQYVEELQDANQELTRFNSVFVARELRMIELKKEVNKLCVESGWPPRYPLEFEKVDEKGT
jgi:hypothetical protein